MEDIARDSRRDTRIVRERERERERENGGDGKGCSGREERERVEEVT